jgi:hypothetical protein
MKIRQEEMLMAYFDKLNYSKNWENPADFPSYEPSETQVRADLQLLHDEARAALNALVDKLESPGCAANLPVESAQFAAKNLLAALEELLAAAREAQAGTIFPGSVTEEKLAAAVREKLNACDVVYSMNDPTPAENPAAGYPAAKLWLRPPFTVTNLAPDWSFATGGDWTAVHGTASASGGALTLAGTSASRYGELDCLLAAPAGHTVRVYLRATAVAGQMESFTLTVNGAAQALQSGDSRGRPPSPARTAGSPSRSRPTGRTPRPPPRPPSAWTPSRPWTRRRCSSRARRRSRRRASTRSPRPRCRSIRARRSAPSSSRSCPASGRR